MKVLVIGQGGREHALVKSLSRSTSVSEIHAIPGNDGMKRLAICHSIDLKNYDAVIQFCIANEIEYVIIGPDEIVASPLADLMRERGILVFAPSQEASQLESSKIFSKKFMFENEIPTAHFVEVESVEDVLNDYRQFQPPYVLKADGLAAGKGVYICQTVEELKTAAEEVFLKKRFGNAGNKAIMEQFQTGWETSLHILTNGETYQILPTAQDHKRIFDNDKGPNTGGMGTVAPLSLDAKLLATIEEKIVKKTLEGLSKKNFLYRGVLFIGLMITTDGPKVLEYNCRFGDPETQVILPLIEGDVAEIFKAITIGVVKPIKLKSLFTTCVILASPGYPDQPVTNQAILGDLEFESEFSYFIHAGTKKDPLSKEWVTAGGRVLGSIGIGQTKEESINNAYKQSQHAFWEGKQQRKDIGARFLKM